MANLLDVCWKEEPEGHLLRRPDFWKLRSRRATAAQESNWRVFKVQRGSPPSLSMPSSLNRPDVTVDLKKRQSHVFLHRRPVGLCICLLQPPHALALDEPAAHGPDAPAALEFRPARLGESQRNQPLRARWLPGPCFLEGAAGSVH